ncbi:MAG: DNA polymerase III subunit gamma/tau [Saprospiraceae bacterium]|nr:DNA polymerase III subunit gamma/tau [Saprospiraceae bacterium]
MSAFVVSARKYRPQKFEEVVGQEHVSQTLKNALKTEHLAHAFLFCGPRGVGKTTCARILAMVINCENKSTDFEPCGTCLSCVAFQHTASFNIVELDAASHNSVDHIRSLVEQVRIPPQGGNYKVFIIDEVHMLSTAAFNAFLKTLEEPPPYAIFILATTEKHKILPTILSRCQIYDFRRISVPQMVSHLKSIADKESIIAEETALHMIAQKADGALRDALSLFDRLVSGGRGQLTYQQVISNLNILDYEIYLKLTEALLTENMPAVLTLFHDVIQKGFEPDIFLAGLTDHFRNLLVCKNQETIALLDLTDTVKDKYLEHAYMIPISYLVSALDLLNECDVHYKTARNKRLHMEMTLIKLTYLNRVLQRDLHPESDEKKNFDIYAPGKLEVSSLNQEKIQDNIIHTATQVNQPTQNAEPDKPVAPISSGLKKKNLIGPSLNHKDDIVAQVKAESHKQNGLKTIFTIEEISVFWRAYAADSVSNSVRSVMELARLEMGEGVLRAFIGSNFGKNILLQETAIIDKMRAELNLPRLAFDVVIDPEMGQEEPQQSRPQTAQEKYDYLVQINPVVSKLVKELNLKPEE